MSDPKITFEFVSNDTEDDSAKRKECRPLKATKVLIDIDTLETLLCLAEHGNFGGVKDHAAIVDTYKLLDELYEERW